MDVEGARASRLPVLFVGHGSPMNAIKDNVFVRRWRALAREFPRPRAILCVSAHWETPGIFLTASARPPTIHDFGGFPKPLFDVEYAVPGDPALAVRAATLLHQKNAGLDPKRGLDHGCWSVLRVMYPQADIPVVQLSLDTRQDAAFHYALAKQLAPLRDEQVLIVGTGNIIHNLGVIDYDSADGLAWAVRINAAIKQRVEARDHAALIDIAALDPDISLAIPSPEHYLPFLYALALQGRKETVSFFNDQIVMGSISMTSIKIQ